MRDARNNPHNVGSIHESRSAKPAKRRGIFLRLSKYVLAQWPLFIPAVIFTLLSNQLSLLGPSYSGAAIDAIENAGGVDFPAVWENETKNMPTG